MNRLFCTVTVIFCCTTFGVQAQDTTALHTAKMEMIRAAVNFYSVANKKPIPGDSCSATDVAGLKSCATGIKGVDKKIESWAGVPVSNAANLETLGSHILEEVSQGHDERKQLKEYAGFKSKIESLKAGGKPVPADIVSPQSTIAERPAVQGRKDSLMEPEATMMEDTQPATPFWKEPLLWSGLALLIAIAALINSFRPRKRHGNRSDRLGSRQPVFENAVGMGNGDNLGNTVALKRQVDGLEGELNTLNTMISDVEKRLNEKMRKMESEGASSGPQVAYQSATPSSSSAMAKKWAKNVDSGGFDMDALASEPDSKMIYEISQESATTASYRVSDIRDAQLFALSNPQNYLREGCAYATQPASNSQITTNQPGRLELQGRKWRIMSPAQIAFS